MMSVPRAAFAQLPLLPRCALAGAAVSGLLGCVAGLVVGLLVFPRTALFATLELGLPASALGLAIGLLAGSAHLVVRTITGARRQR
jgi:hypothetical protein